MAGFEIVVRPAVFPDIRPLPAQPVPPADDPEKGFATIRGNGAKTVSSSYSYSSSTSTSQRSEIERRVDEARIYQKDDNGSVNKENFVDIEVANRIRMKGPPGLAVRDTGTTTPGFAGTERQVFYYDPIQESDNIEILKKNKIKVKGESSE